MSHFTKISTEIRDLAALKKAAESMGFHMIPGASCRYYFGEKEMDHVIRLPGKYDLGVKSETEGRYSLQADFWAGHVTKYVGPNASLLMQKYSLEKIRCEAEKMGLSIFSGENPNQISLYDTETGGTINCTVTSDGQATFATEGFEGGTCMKFRALEEALGATQEMEYTSEYYVPETRAAATIEVGCEEQ